MSEEPRKRSRFDQTEPKRSRFDRRSRSPGPEKKQETSRRSRSPAPEKKSRGDATAAAAAAAARINAQLQAQRADAPPTPSVSQPFSFCSPLTRIHQAPIPVVRKSNDVARVTNEVYTQDGDYIRDIEINDLRNRYLLTKGSTQQMVITTLVHWH